MTKYFLIIFLNLLNYTLLADKLDSLNLVYNSQDQPDTNRLKALVSIASFYCNNDPDTAIILAQKLVKFAEKNNYLKYKGIGKSTLGIALRNKGDYTGSLEILLSALKDFEKLANKVEISNCNNNLGTTYLSKGDLQLALEKYHISLNMRKEIDDKKGVAACHNNIGLVYMNFGNYPQALSNFLSALKINDEIGNTQWKAINLTNIGNIYARQLKYDLALKNYFSALKIHTELNNKVGLFDCYNNIGNIYDNQNKENEALASYLKAISIAEKLGHRRGIAHCYTGIGNLYQDKLEYDSSLKNYMITKKIMEEIGDKASEAGALLNIGFVLTRLHRYSEARDNLNNGLNLSKIMGLKEWIKESYKALATLDSLGNNCESEIKNYKLYMLYRDSLYSEESKKKMTEQNLTYEFEKKELETKAIQDKKDIEIRKEKEQQRIITYSIATGFILVLILALFIFRVLRQKQKANLIITRQKFEVEHQKNLVEEKHKEITDSINYAERIQRSFLATNEHLDGNLNEYFVLFKPKDVVSGDFYWSSTLNNGNFALVTADSTGHGVPGAIMSLLNITSLEKAIETLTEPSDILNSTRKTIINRLKRDGSAGGGKDGMDASLTAYDFKNKKLIIAAANNPVWIVRSENGTNNIIELKPDKMPIGKHDKEDIPFAQQEFDLQKGDIVYTLTDGFPDQFGGEKGKKFMSKNLRELLAKNSHLPMDEQKSLLEKAFKNWVGDMEQVDDVTVIGIRI